MLTLNILIWVDYFCPGSGIKCCQALKIKSIKNIDGYGCSNVTIIIEDYVYKALIYQRLFICHVIRSIYQPFWPCEGVAQINFCVILSIGVCVYSTI